jgi:hypothetical protein
MLVMVGDGTISPMLCGCAQGSWRRAALWKHLTMVCLAGSPGHFHVCSPWAGRTWLVHVSVVLRRHHQ